MPVRRPGANDFGSAQSGIRAQIRDLDTENIAELAVRARALGDVIPLWYGEGDDVTSEPIRAAAKAALDEGTTFYVPTMRGLPALTEALSAYLTGLYRRPIPVERSTVTPGGMQALYLGLSLILDPGTNAVYLEPQWPNIARTIFMAGAEPRPVPLGFDTDFRLDLDRVFAACDARTRAIVFSTPSNPTGWTASRDELQALLDFSRRTGIWIVSDEVYGRLYFEADAAPSILELAGEDDRVLVINSFSKAWAMTGWRVGWLNHPAGVAAEVAAMTQYMNSGTAGFVQAGALHALQHGEPVVAAIKAKLKAGMDLAYAKLQGHPAFVLPDKPRGGMYTFFALQGEADAREACFRILDKAHVGLAPGFMFGRSANRFLRMCVLRDQDPLRRALDRMVEAFA
ncbi:pyridoxal phosphate-dependent aminotransferase [Lichenifustis flavocetrariae]|uniref:Aminotransferase n=1 Tax=Lichenifustis flavocetrariae TaxID=2949735 RepID=A0AA41Z675_9HYPH|nr:pyridoxal phosphate-dependent aminotransferase [Lichenifustis flavocetrariae]MCW6510017.1 pyridoxal phosphate-dependent aminotransferase [Lichenifustis flavocetrariae]